MRRGNADMLTVAPLTSAILAINFVMYFLSVTESGGDVSHIGGHALLKLGGSMRERLWEGEWLRLIAPTFLHGGFLHILLNTMFLYQVGPLAEVHFGSANFGTIYLLSGVGGFCLSQIFGGTLSIGASCSLFGIMGAVLAVKILQAPVLRNAWKNSEVRQVAWIIALNLAIGLSGMLNIDNWGHLGGLLVGLPLALGFELWRQRHRAGIVVMLGSLLLVAGLVVAARWSVFSPYYHLHRGVLAVEEKQSDAVAQAHFAKAAEVAKYWKNERLINTLVAHYHLGHWDGQDARDRGYRLIAMYYQGRLRYAPPPEPPAPSDAK